MPGLVEQLKKSRSDKKSSVLRYPQITDLRLNSKRADLARIFATNNSLTGSNRPAVPGVGHECLPVGKRPVSLIGSPKQPPTLEYSGIAPKGLGRETAQYVQNPGGQGIGKTDVPFNTVITSNGNSKVVLPDQTISIFLTNDFDNALPK